MVIGKFSQSVIFELLEMFKFFIGKSFKDFAEPTQLISLPGIFNSSKLVRFSKILRFNLAGLLVKVIFFSLVFLLKSKLVI
jgi:hypothetical protein